MPIIRGAIAPRDILRRLERRPRWPRRGEKRARARSNRRARGVRGGRSRGGRSPASSRRRSRGERLCGPRGKTGSPRPRRNATVPTPVHLKNRATQTRKPRPGVRVPPAAPVIRTPALASDGRARRRGRLDRRRTRPRGARRRASSRRAHRPPPSRSSATPLGLRARALPSRPPDRRRARPPARRPPRARPSVGDGQQGQADVRVVRRRVQGEDVHPESARRRVVLRRRVRGVRGGSPGRRMGRRGPPAFGGGGGGGGGGSTLNRAPARSDSDSDSGAGASKARKRKRKKKGRRSARGGDGAASASSGGLPVEDDPRCLAVLDVLDRRRVVLTQPGAAFDAACEACANADRLAVDCEGTSMSRVGEVTLLQVALAANDDASDSLPSDDDGADDGADDKADLQSLLDPRLLERPAFTHHLPIRRPGARARHLVRVRVRFEAQGCARAPDLAQAHVRLPRGQRRVVSPARRVAARRLRRAARGRRVPPRPVARGAVSPRGSEGGPAAPSRPRRVSVEAALGARGARRAEARSEAEGFVPGATPSPGRR